MILNNFDGQKKKSAKPTRVMSYVCQYSALKVRNAVLL